MIVDKGEKVHIVYRALYEHSNRRHFLGEVLTADGSVCRLKGFVFVYDKNAATFMRKPEPRVTIIDLAESGYVVNIVDPGVNLEQVVYRYLEGVGLTATDGKDFALNINEFTAKS